jgi:hypothetical protein
VFCPALVADFGSLSYLRREVNGSGCFSLGSAEPGLCETHEIKGGLKGCLWQFCKPPSCSCIRRQLHAPGVAYGVSVAMGVADGVPVAVGVSVSSGVLVPVAVGVSVDGLVAEGVEVGVSVSKLVSVGVAVSEAVGVGEGM